MNMTENHETLPSDSRYAPRALDVIKELDARVEDVYREVCEQRFWHALLDPQTPSEVCLRIFREVFLSIYWYQRHTTEASFHMIGRFPKSEATMLRLTMLHRIEEAGHSEWALRDYSRLGGDSRFATTSPLSPATFAVSGVWWRMAMVEEPLGYFGAEYLFEYLTLIVAQPMVALFKQRGFRADGLGFIIDHATEDEKHAKLVRHLIADAVTRYPGSEVAMLRCFDYFRQVYPLPVWSEAYERAMRVS